MNFKQALVISGCIFLIGCSNKKIEKTLLEKTVENTLLEKALEKSKKYIENINFLETNNANYMIPDLLDKEFQTNLKLPNLKILEDQDKVFKECHFKLYDRYFDNRDRLVINIDFDSLYAISAEALYDMDVRTFWCMYCDKYDIPETVLPILRQKIYESDYALTHALLQIQSIIENNYCSLPKDEVNALKSLSLEQVDIYLEIAYANKEVVLLDAFYEALALKLYAGDYSNLKEEYINFVINQQKEDGGWSKDLNTVNSNPHSTILVFWFLLELKRNNENTAIQTIKQ